MATQKRFVVKNGLDNNGLSIINVANPVNTSDAVTKAYADLKPDLSSTTPAALGTAAVGVGTTAARGGCNTARSTAIHSALSSCSWPHAIGCCVVLLK